MRIAFHTPLNALGDDGISGDRRMARQLAAALGSLGHTVEPVAAERTYLRQTSAASFADQQRDAARRREHLLAEYRAGRPRPDIWFTYHNYYRAPDLLGPDIAEALGIPYVTAESSDSSRRSRDEWAAQSAAVRRALAAGDVHFHFTDRDRQGLEPWRRQGTDLVALPPFVDVPVMSARPPGTAGTARLITVAMMRGGAKQSSYLALARILGRLRDDDWQLGVVGDGPLRGTVETAFAGLPAERITWHGRLDHAATLEQLAAHDVFVWPGVGEAYGLVYLEAQATGLPVVAFDSGGVAATMRPGETALLIPEHDEETFAAALAQLLRDRQLRDRMGEAARRFILAERTIARAAERLADGLARACRNRAGKLLPPAAETAR